MCNDLDKRFREIILKCQELREKYGFNYEEKTIEIREKFSNEIITKKLVNKCSESDFAKQLCVMNSLKCK